MQVWRPRRVYSTTHSHPRSARRELPAADPRPGDEPRHSRRRAATQPRSSRELRAAVAVLERIVADRTLLAHIPADDRRRLLQAAGHVYSPDAVSRRQLVRATARAGRRSGSSARSRRGAAPGSAPSAGSRCSPRPTCSRRSRPKRSPPRTCTIPTRRASRSSRSTATSASRTSPALHHFYDQLCPPCAEFNFAKRTELADLRGTVALLTGGRVKIGYQAGLKLLRAGAHLIVTTRFPRDSAARYARRAGLRRVGRPARDLRPRPASHAERRGVLPRAAWRRATGSTSS